MTSTRYCIRVKGHLGPEWSEWFEGLAVTPQANGETVFEGLLADEASLYGLLLKVRDLGLPLVGLSQAAVGPTVTRAEEEVPPADGKTGHER